MYKSNHFLFKRNHNKCQIKISVSVPLVKHSENIEKLNPKHQNTDNLVFHADFKLDNCIEKLKQTYSTAALEIDALHRQGSQTSAEFAMMYLLNASRVKHWTFVLSQRFIR